MSVVAAIEVDSWTACVAARLPVGSCSQELCPGSLFPEPPEKVGGKVWYSAICDVCGYEVVSPDGKRVGAREPIGVAAARPDWTRPRERDFRERAAGD